MKKIKLIIMLCFIVSNLQAQYTCGNNDENNTSENKANNCNRINPSDNSDENLLLYNYIPNDTTPIITIKVNVNIWNRDDGTGNYWKDLPEYRDTLRQVFDWINYFFSNNVEYSQPIDGAPFIADTKIRMELDSVYYYNNTALAYYEYNDRIVNYIGDYYPERLSNFNYNFTLNQTAGHSGISTGYNAFHHSVVTVREAEENVGGNMQIRMYAFAHHMVHEFCHNFGLNHTYNSDHRDITHPDFLWDVFGRETQLGCNAPQGFVCYHDAEWACDPTDTSNTCTNNTMGGTQAARHFSALQCAKLHRAVAISTIKKYAYGYHNIPIVIYNNQTWDYSRKLYQDIVIESGKTLTVTCTLEMVSQVKIIIHPGGQLIIDGGTLTNACDGQMWKGIVVESDPAQLPTKFNAHGRVILRNGATIANASVAIAVPRTSSYPYHCAGRISATDAHFINNVTSVLIGTRINTSPVPTAENCINYSNFTNCTFSSDNDIVGFSLDEVYLSGVHGVSFSGCTFHNEFTRVGLYSSAIYAIDAGFTVKDKCSPPGHLYYNETCPEEYYRETVFDGYLRGITVNNTGANQTFSIENSLFINNETGILASGVNSLSVKYCTFDIGASRYSQNIGIQLDNTPHFIIEENRFTSNNETAIGLMVTRSGANNNQVYKNSYENLSIGQQFEGSNRGTLAITGLTSLCNTFSGILTTDILVSSNQEEFSTPAGIRYIQSNDENMGNGIIRFLAAGNSFSKTYKNETNEIVYYYDLQDMNAMPPSFFGIDPFGTVSCSCPSRKLTYPRRFDRELSLSLYESAKSEYNNTLYNYNQLLDGGNTALLLHSIQGEWSNDVWKIHQKLMAESPYVSKDVLCEVAKANLLSHALYLEVCLANVDATRDYAFLDFLRKIPNSLPEYMINLIKANWSTKTLRTDMEQLLAGYGSIKDGYLDGLIHDMLGDSIVDRAEIRALYRDRGDYSDVLTLAESYMEELDFKAAHDILEELKSSGKKLSKAEFQEIADFKDYIFWRESLVKKKSSIYSLDDKDLTELVEYVKSHTGRGAVLADIILCKLYDICTKEKNLQKSAIIPYNGQNENTSESPSLGSIEVYPNPAQSYTSFAWDFGSFEGTAILTISDLSGRRLLSRTLSGAQGEWVWDTRNLTNGLYFYQVEMNGLNAKSGKIAIMK